MDVLERFSDEPVALWVSDLTWVSDNVKVRALLLAIFSRRTRLSHIQGRFWKRVIDLYWKAGWTKRQIAETFGCDRENVRRIVRSLRGEAKRFFGQAVQPYVGQSVQPKTKPAPIAADPTNESQVHWNGVLASHGLFDPDKPMYRGQQQWKNPRYKFDWPSKRSVYALAWPEFFESAQAKLLYDPERVHHFLAHVPTTRDVDLAMYGNAEAQVFLRE